MSAKKQTLSVKKVDRHPTSRLVHYGELPEQALAGRFNRNQPSWALAGSGGIRASPRGPKYQAFGLEARQE